MNLGKTIQIFLPDGNPRGIKIAEITSRTVKVLLIPRSLLAEAANRNELRNVAIYFLVGPMLDDNKPGLYVGEAEDILTRLQQHNREKAFWTHVLVGLSKTHYFTKTHIKFLEAFCYREAAKSDRFVLQNNQVPTEPHLSEPMRVDLLDNFDTLKILVGTLGYPLFDKIQKPRPKNILICTGKDAYAEGEYTEEGLIVFAGAKCRMHETKSMPKTMKALHRSLVKKGILVPSIEGEASYTLETNQIFSSPSAAAAFVLSRSAGGWTEWKYKEDGRTLDEVIRKQN